MNRYTGGDYDEYLENNKFYRRYQVQVETRKRAFYLEVGTNDFKANDIARDFIRNLKILDEEEEYELQIGGSSEIGTARICGVLEYKRYDGYGY
jgi:hypothetical protein